MYNNRFRTRKAGGLLLSIDPFLCWEKLLYAQQAKAYNKMNWQANSLVTNKKLFGLTIQLLAVTLEAIIAWNFINIYGELFFI